MQNRITDGFKIRFGQPALLVRGPGRVNLIGEHTDYNLGFVLPGAVDKAIWLALSPRSDTRCRFHALDMDADFDGDLGTLMRSGLGWPDYLLGVLSELKADGHDLRGVDVVFGGDVPIGSGMSSSAALECAFAFGLNEAFGLGLDRPALARIGQRAENRFVGVACGIMDQFASVLGQDGHLLHLDCRDLSTRAVPFRDPDLRIVLCDTQVRRTLAGSEYNVRRAQCEAGVAHLASHAKDIESLRDVPLALLEAHKAELDAVVYRRCAYVLAENQRVLDACAALESGDIAALGPLLNASHAGLRADYEVSCAELDLLAETAQTLPGVLGSRMMGGGFGGCTLSLVRADALETFQEGMAPAFARLGKSPVIHVCRLTGGTERVG